MSRRTSPRVVVRAAGVDQVPLLARWNLALIRDEGNDNRISVDEIEARLREWLEQGYRAHVFEMDGVPCGYAIHRELPDITHLRHYYVEPAFRRQGIGRAAFDALRRDILPGDRKLLVEALVTNGPGVAFWEALGFEQRYVGLQFNPGSKEATP